MPAHCKTWVAEHGYLPLSSFRSRIVSGWLHDIHVAMVVALLPDARELRLLGMGLQEGF